MKYLMSAEWWKAAGIRAAKTMFQTGAALVVTQMPGGTVEAGEPYEEMERPELEKGDKA